MAATGEPPDHRLSPAHITRGPGGALYAPDYGDVYHSRTGAWGEAEAVFLAGQDLPARFAAGSAGTVAETGFGLGINFLACWCCWARQAPPGARLVYIAVEKHPPRAQDLADTLAAETLAGSADARARALIAAWPGPRAGWHRRILAPEPGDPGSVTLVLGLGDALTRLRELNTGVAAWLLDGFAPSRNPAMWSPDLLAEIARLSIPGATAASYTVAGTVRRGLAEAGFTVTRRPGAGAKTTILHASWPGGGENGRVAAQPQSSPGTSAAKPARAVVVGAGLAGAWCAWELARAGWPVTVLEAGPGPASGASGIPAATLALPPQAGDSPRARFLAAAYSYTLGALTELGATTGAELGPAGDGLIHVADDARTARRLVAAPHVFGLPEADWQAISPAEAAARLGQPVPGAAARLPHAGWLAPARITAALLTAAGATLQANATVDAVVPAGEGWQVQDRAGTCLAAGSVVVLAMGWPLPSLPPGLATPPCQPVGGQADCFAIPAGAPALTAAISGHGYIVPDGPGHVWVGATFAPGTARPEPDPAATTAHAERLAERLPAFAGAAHVASWCGVRASTPDRLPVAGTLAPGLAISAGHGARGTLTAPAAAAHVAAAVTGTPTPLVGPAAEAVAPGRFAQL